MGKSSGKAPAAPDPVATAQAQTASNIDTARFQAELNRVNQITPYGSLTWQQTSKPPAWNEAAYLAANPDVAYHVQQGWAKSGQEHYERIGKTEGRAGVPEGYGGAGQWQSTVTLTPEQQRLLDLQQQGQTKYGEIANSQLDRLREILSQPLTLEGLPAMGSAYMPGAPLGPTLTEGAYGFIDPTIDPNSTAQRDRVEAALFGRLQPQMEADRARLESQLANRGISPGTTAWTRAMDDFQRQQNDARLAVTAAGGQEQALQASIANMLFGQQDANRKNLLTAQQALFGQQVAGRAMGMQEQGQEFGQMDRLRQQAINELLVQRQVPLNEVAALLGGSQVQYPTFAGVPQAGAANTDVLGAYGISQSAKNAAHQSAVAQEQGMWSGIAGLGSAAILALALSDRRAKENVERVGKTDDGQAIYLFNYKGNRTPQMGLMAQDVEKRNPGAVHTDPGTGLKLVDYKAALFGGRRH